MPVVSTRHSSAADAAEVWAAVLDCESFPTYMPEVREVVLLSQDGNQRLGRWSVLLKGSHLEWEESETIDHERMRIDFHQTEGDLAYFTGHWQVSRDGADTVVELHVEFDIGIPLMAEMLNPVAARALEDNSRAILESLSQRAGRAVVDAHAPGAAP